MKDNAGIKCDTDYGPCACGTWHDEIDRLRARVTALEGVIARSLAECREMQRQAELTPWPYEWERRIDDLEDAPVGAYPFTRGDEEWEKLNAQLADVMKVVEAVRVLDVHNGNSIVRLADALRDYDAKHGAK
jgi:hypothetical protein